MFVQVGMSVLSGGLCVCECQRVHTCVRGFPPQWGAGMFLCTHTASPGAWVAMAGPSSAIPSSLDLPGSLRWVTPA